jgi:hypothetical protein
MPHIAFFSYTHLDDQHCEGRLIKICKLLQEDIRRLTGEQSFTIFLDRDDIQWGQNWKRVIDGGLNEAAFLIPVLSPTYLQRPECRRECLEFIAKESRDFGEVYDTKKDGKILPLLYLPIPDESIDEIFVNCKIRQWIDFQTISILGGRFPTKSIHSQIRTMAERLVALRKLFDAETELRAIGPHAYSEKLKNSFVNASHALRDWRTTLPDGSWIETHEWRALVQVIDNQQQSGHVLTGPPGSGKSALLSRLVQHCIELGIIVLGIKTDFLSGNLNSMQELARELINQDVDLCDAILRLSVSHKVVVVLDQLDALADLADLKSGRLNLLLRLIGRLRGQSNVHLVCSSRKFEFMHDTRLSSLVQGVVRTELKEIELQPLPRNTVTERIVPVAASGFELTEGWLDLLSLPYNLRLFMEILRDNKSSTDSLMEAAIFDSVHQLHARRWEDTVMTSAQSSERIHLLNELASRIADTEEMRLPVSQFDSYAGTVGDLERFGWVTRHADTIGFAHQTQFEFVLARGFAASPDNFIRHVRERSNGLFVRKTVWHTLNYLRATNPTGYEKTLAHLIETITRRHLKALLLDFLGQVSEPRPFEIRHVIECLNDEETHAQMAFRLRGHSGWFNALEGQVIPVLMSLPPNRCWPVLRILESAWPFAKSPIRALVQKYWLNNSDYFRLLWELVQAAPAFDEELVKWLTDCSANLDLHTWEVNHAVEQVGKSRPDIALQILVEHWNRQASLAVAQPRQSQIANQVLAGDGNTVPPVAHASLGLQIGSDSWLCLVAIAESAPAALLEYVWPWFVRAIQATTSYSESKLKTFRDECNSYRWCDPDFYQEVPVPNSLSLAITAICKSDPHKFLVFAKSEGKTDSVTVQKMLAVGVASLSDLHPELTFAFLTEDERRFLLGDYGNGMSITQELVRVAVPYWTPIQVAEFQEAVLKWNPYRESVESSEVVPSCVSELRARLLNAIPTVHQIAPAQELIAAESKKHGGLKTTAASHPKMYSIESPVKCRQMKEMSDGDIAELFNELIDSTGSHHPKDWRIGGSEQASHEFGEFAKDEPDRAAAIVRRLRPIDQEIPAGQALIGLSNAGWNPRKICQLVRYLNKKGFCSAGFRDDVGQALSEVAIKNDGLPDDICKLMAMWLLDVPNGPMIPLDDVLSDSEQSSVNESSILWPQGGLFSLPNNWYWLGLAVRYGFCLRKKPKSIAWKRVFESCLDREYSSRVWTAWLESLLNYTPNRKQLSPVIGKLLFQRRDVFNTESGVRAFAGFSWWMSHRDRSKLLGELEKSNWQRSALAAGEIVGLWAIQYDDENSIRRIDTVLESAEFPQNNSQFVIGLACAAAKNWCEIGFRQYATEILCRLTRSKSKSVGRAMLTAVLRDGCLRADEATVSFLTAIAQNTDFGIVGQHYWLSQRLIEIIDLQPQLVLRVCQRIVATVRAARDISQTQYGESIGHLVTIALTLHRDSNQTIREESLSMFEDLLDMNAYTAADALKHLDQRPLVKH